MITMPPMSSAMARVSRNSRAPRGTRRPNRDSTPREKAMSVATGTAHPRAASPPPTNAR